MTQASSFMPTQAQFFDLTNQTFQLTSEELALLERNGFMVSDRLSFEDFSMAYGYLFWKDLPPRRQQELPGGWRRWGAPHEPSAQKNHQEFSPTYVHSPQNIAVGRQIRNRSLGSRRQITQPPK